MTVYLGCVVKTREMVASLYMSVKKGSYPIEL